MKKKLPLFFIMVFSAVTFATELPRIAVYVTGDIPDNVKNALGTRMLSAFINLGRYRGIERSNAFLAELEKEQIRQRSGAIDDSQISKLGRQFGVNFICVANVIPLFDAFQVSARIIDVETAEIVHIGESYSPLQTVEDFRKASHEVVRVMLGGNRGQAAGGRHRSQPQRRSEPMPEPEPILISEPEPKYQPKPEPEPAYAAAPKPAPAAVEQPRPKEPAASPVQAAPSQRTLDDVMADGRKRTEPKPDVSQPKSSIKPTLWAGIGLDIIGAGLIVYGIIENENVKKNDDKGEFSSAKKSARYRNIAYGVGMAALMSGISLHIFF